MLSGPRELSTVAIAVPTDAIGGSMWCDDDERSCEGWE